MIHQVREKQRDDHTQRVGMIVIILLESTLSGQIACISMRWRPGTVILSSSRCPKKA